VRPLVPVSTGAKIVLGVAFFVLFFAAWAAATLGGYVNRTFLADPLTMVRAGWLLLTVHGFYEDIGVTIWRVFGGFALAAAAGVPLGIVMGPTSDRGVLRALHLVRALPARLGLHSAADPVGRHRRGREAGGDLHRLLLPAGADGRRDRRQHAARSRGGRLHAGRARLRHRAARAASQQRARHRRDAAAGARWAWTYVIVAELIGASSGIGHMITDSQALLDTGQIIFGIVVIGIIAS